MNKMTNKKSAASLALATVLAGVVSGNVSNANAATNHLGAGAELRSRLLHSQGVLGAASPTPTPDSKGGEGKCGEGTCGGHKK